MSERKFLSALCSTCETVMPTLDYNEALYSLLKNTVNCLKAKAGGIRLFDRSGGKLELASAFGIPEANLNKEAFDAADSPIDKLTLSRKVVQRRDISQDKWFQNPMEAKRQGIKSVLSIALHIGHKKLGIMRIYKADTRVFRDEEISFVSALAAQGAGVIRNAQRYNRLKSLNEIGKTVTSQLDIENVLDTVCKSAVKDVSARGASILLFGREMEQLEVVAAYGLSEKFIHKGPISIDKSISDCLKGKDVIIEDTENDPRIQYPGEVKKEGIKSIICVPLKVKEVTIGTLRIYTGYKYKMDKEDLQFINILGDFSAVAIENARLFQHVKSNYDELTMEVWKWYDWGERSPRI